jgi:phosphoribosylformylglycinamidine synthase PurS subunit
MWLARVYVTLKPTVNDPQGLAIRGGLHHLGFESVESVRAGMYLELRLDELDEGRARERVDAMCRQLLADPVIKEYRSDLEPAGS